MTVSPELPHRPHTGSPKICVHCDRHVYAKFLCKAHYERARRERNREATLRLRAERKEAKLRKYQRALETEGAPCIVSFCEVLTLDDTGLCEAHRQRSRRWQFSPGELARIYAAGACEACGATENLSLDHAHGLPCEPDHIQRNGCPECFRGLLCAGCNSALGFVRDDPKRLRDLIRYLDGALT